MLVEYGMIAVVVYLAIFFIVLFAFWAAIRFGWQPTGVAANVGIWTAAYIATKLTQPLRILATLAITPLLAKLYERVTGKPRVTPAIAPGVAPGVTPNRMPSGNDVAADE
jgi:hypothetical protein